MSRFVNFKTCSLILVLAAASCVRDDQAHCPPMPVVKRSVVVAVADKNYVNARDVGAPVVDETLPFATWITALETWNRPPTGTTTTPRTERVAPGELTHPLDATLYPAGDNVIMAVAGDPTPTGATVPRTIALHPEGGEGADVYLGAATVTFPLTADQTIPLYRAKGRLIIDTSLLPATVTSITVTVGNLYGEVGIDPAGRAPEQLLNYSGTTTVTKTFTGSGGMILAPSATAGDSSPLTITFTGDDGTPVTISSTISIVRNRITVVRPEWNPVTREWTITVSVDGRWAKINNLTITDE